MATLPTHTSVFFLSVFFFMNFLSIPAFFLQLFLSSSLFPSFARHTLILLILTFTWTLQTPPTTSPLLLHSFSSLSPRFQRICILLIDTRALHQPLSFSAFLLASISVHYASSKRCRSFSSLFILAFLLSRLWLILTSPVLYIFPSLCTCVHVVRKFMSTCAGHGNKPILCRSLPCEQKQPGGQKTRTDGSGLMSVHSQYTVNWVMHYGKQFQT